MNKIFKNSLFNVITAVILTPIAFILPPYTIAKIGLAGYGIFALTNIVNRYATFINLGFGTSLIRFVAKSDVTKDYQAISEYFITSLITYLFLSITIGSLIFLSRYYIVINILNIKEDIDIAVFLVTVSLITITFNMTNGLLNSIIVGLQRMDITNIILFTNSVLSAFFVFVVLESGFGLKGLAVKTLILSVITLLVNIIVTKSLIPLKINPLLFSRTRFKEMFSYSVNLQLTSILTSWIDPINKILISHFFSVSFVAYYEVAIKFIERITILIRQSINPIFPASAELFEKSGIAKIEKLREITSKYLFIIVITLFVGLLIIVPDFVILWLGPDMRIVSPTILLFLVGTCISLLATSPWALLNGLGFSKETLLVQIQIVIVNVIGIIVLSISFGFYGFCIAYSLSMIYGFFATHYYYKKKMGIKQNVYKVFHNKKVIITNIIFFIVTFTYVKFFPLHNYMLLFTFIGIYGLIYSFIIWKFKIVTKTDLELLLGKNIYNRLIRNLKLKR